MKFISPTSTYIAVAAAAAIHSTSVSAFAPQHQHLSCAVSTCTVPAHQALHAMIPEHENENNEDEVTLPSRRKAFTIAGGVVGWILGPRLANAAGAYIPEAGYDSLDFSMPSYSVDKNAAPPKDNAYGDGDSASASVDPAKEAERLERIERAQMKKKEKEEMEEAKAKAYFDKIKAKEEKDAEKARVKAEVEAGRAAMKEAKLKS